MVILMQIEYDVWNWKKVQDNNDGLKVYANDYLVTLVITKNATITNTWSTICTISDSQYRPLVDMGVSDPNSTYMRWRINKGGTVQIATESTSTTRTVNNIITYPRKSALP